MKKFLHVMIGTLLFLGSYNIVLAQTFVGSESCSGCHPDKYGDWVASGHPYKFTIIENGQPPVYPPEAINFQSQWMENLGDGSHDWDVVAGVIGGYGWKARFVGDDGHLIGTAGSAYSTGLGHNQFNFYDGENHGWVDYHPADEKIYNYGCFKCHTTGGDTTGTWLEGVEGLGTFTEGGVGCEGCHGPGSDHIAAPTSSNIDKVYEFAHQDNAIGGLQVGDDIQTPDPDGDDINFLCGTCHNRSYTDPINSSGGFIKHHEQWDEFTATKHNGAGFTCITCHDPHKRVIWGGDGITIACASCHTVQVALVNHGSSATCIDCHMPFAAKSGTTRGESGYKGDVRSHLFTINTDTASMFVLDGSVVKDDDEREAALSPHFACLGCHNDDPNDNIPDKTIEEVSEEAAGMHSTLPAATFVGSESCSGCHPGKYGDWVASGHPYKFTIIENGQPPVYPPEAINFQSQWMENLGDGSHDWDVVAGVIGGYGWKARFVGDDGHLIGTAGSAYSTGVGHNQFNFYDGENHGWVDYHPADEKIYNYGCFKCHTTGGDTTGTWLEGVEGLGTFTEGGVGCESCHGPGSIHITGPTSSNIDKVYEFAHQDNAIGGLQVGDEIQTPDPDGNDINFLCGTCHNRSYTDPINSSGGFIKHHEQWDEFTATKHNGAGFTCITCHDPHKRVIWDGDGITITCATCHSDQVDIVNHGSGATCIDCHMPFAAKSGTTRGESGYKGDVRSHLFTINTDTASMFVLDGSVVKDDDEREAALSPHFACLGCHNDDPNDEIPDKTIEEASAEAAGMHVESGIAKLNINNLGLFPNPSQGATKITFTLFNSSEVSVSIYSATGQLVYGVSDIMSVGNQAMIWDGTSNTGTAIESGFYFVKLSVGDNVSVQKLILMK